jgi:hypothetical protein
MRLVTTAATTFLEGILPMRFLSVLIAVAALSLVGASGYGAMARAPSPRASATVSPGHQFANVWIVFSDGSKKAGSVMWFGSPEVIDWSTAMVFVTENGVSREISSWWLIGATVTTR